MIILWDVHLAADSWRPCADAVDSPSPGDLLIVTVHMVERGSEAGWVRVHGWLPAGSELSRSNVLVEVRAEALPEHTRLEETEPGR